MAINACTIDGFTLNGRFCRDKFSVLIPILRPPQPTVTGTNPRVLRDTHPYARQFDLEDKPTLTFEQPIVSVSVEFLSLSGTDTQDVSAAQVDFITVTGFEVQGEQESNDSVFVNISDLTFE